MVMDFSGTAGVASDFDTIPNGQLAFAVLTVRGVKDSAAGGGYIDCELTIDQGQPYAGRKVWEKIGNPFHQGNSEKYRQMGMVAITRILEAGRGAGPNNPAGYQLADFSQLSGLRVPIKIGIEKGTDGHDDKNRVSEWLTPNPQSGSGYKGFEKLQRGEFGPSSSAPAPTNGFGGQAQGGAPATTSGFGNSGSGFTGAPAPSSVEAGAAFGAKNAGSQSSQTGAGASPSNGVPTGSWLSQANGGSPQ